MNQQEQQYLDLLAKLLQSPYKADRTGTGTHASFGHQMRFDLSQGLPLLTTKKVHFKSIVVELLWFLKGQTNIRYLLQHGCTIWTEWRYQAYSKHIDYSNAVLNHSKEKIRISKLSQAAFEQRIVEDEHFAKLWGDIGQGYGHQWRNFGATQNLNGSFQHNGFDQITWLINEIKTNPDSRRLIVSGWNPHEIHLVDLPPCHTLFQFHVQQGKLSCQLYQRSADSFLGVPFNIASYALLTYLIAHECDLDVGEFIWTGGDVHLYANHIEQAKQQIARQPMAFPTLSFNPEKHLFDLEPNDVHIHNYQHQASIKAEVAV